MKRQGGAGDEGLRMGHEFGVKFIDKNGDSYWFVFNNRYFFTKSKAEFFKQSILNQGAFSESELSVEAI